MVTSDLRVPSFIVKYPSGSSWTQYIISLGKDTKESSQPAPLKQSPEPGAAGSWWGAPPSPRPLSCFSQDRTGLDGTVSLSHRKFSGSDETAVLDKGKKHSPPSPPCTGSGASGSPYRKGRETAQGGGEGDRGRACPLWWVFGLVPLRLCSMARCSGRSHCPRWPSPRLFHLPTIVIF